MVVTITGGAGYIGTHIIIELIQMGIEVRIIDDLSNSSKDNIRRIEKHWNMKIPFYQVDMTDLEKLRKTFIQGNIPQDSIIIHLAGFKAVGESKEKPVKYYRNNINSLTNLTKVMLERGMKNIIISSTATVYGNPKISPTPEYTSLAPENPYAMAKLIQENILTDICQAHPEWNVIILRFFNPGGAHGIIGEDIYNPKNLIPILSRIAKGEIPSIKIFGVDWPTPDGTCVRDYIHITDLSKGHLKAIDRLMKMEMEKGRPEIFNLGCGCGFSVMEIINTFSEVTGKNIPTIIAPRRKGDTPILVADISKARKLLNWNPEKSLKEICQDEWKWICKLKNPGKFFE